MLEVCKEMKAQLRSVSRNGVDHMALAFSCPGCSELMVSEGVHILAVNTSDVSPSWSFNNDLEKPTLSPSIRTRYNEHVCHSFLKDGVFQFLNDCTHSLAGQNVPMPDLPEWLVN